MPKKVDMDAGLMAAIAALAKGYEQLAVQFENLLPPAHQGSCWVGPLDVKYDEDGIIARITMEGDDWSNIRLYPEDEDD